MSTGLVTSEAFAKQWPVLAPQSEAAQLIRANMAGDNISVADLDRIKVPTGGGTMWTVPTIEGDKSEKFLEGIIIHQAGRRAYWESLQPSGSPPDCASTDLITGVGDPGGDCAACPLNQWGSAVRPDGTKARGKRCKESRLIFLLRAGQNLPQIVVAPPGSLSAFKKWRLKLQVPFYACVVRMSLKKVQNKDGIAYAEIATDFVGPLEPTQADYVKRYAEALTGVFHAAAEDHSDMEEDD